MAVDYYGTLGVSTNASPEEIKRAYRRLARELHPDLNPDPETLEKFKAVTAAYEVLSDPEKRQMYDMGADPLAPRGARGSSGPGAGFGGFDFGDIMDAFFGSSSRGPRPRKRRGQDALIQVEVDLSEAAFGTTRDLQLDTAVLCPVCDGAGTSDGSAPVQCDMCRGRGEIQSIQKSFLGEVRTARVCPQCQGYGTVLPQPCRECNGDGRVRSRESLTVRILAGVDTGNRIQFLGKGEVGPGGGQSGDLYVEVLVKPHSTFERQGDDLHCTVSIPMTAAALGTAMEIETLDGATSFDVKVGTQSGDEVILRRKGMPHLHGHERGDLHVHLDVRTPTRLDDAQTAILQQLAAARGEETPTALLQQNQQGLFSRLRDAFSGR